MFRAYAFGIRAIYLSAIVLAPLFMLEYLVQIFRQGDPDLRGLLWYLLFAALLVLPSLRAWVRIAGRGELIPEARLRSRAIIATLVGISCALAMFTVGSYVYAKWVFISPVLEAPEIVSFVATLFLYSIALPAGETLLVGRAEPTN